MGGIADPEIGGLPLRQGRSADCSEDYPANKPAKKSTESEDESDESDGGDEDGDGDEYDEEEDENEPPDSYPVHTQLQTIVKSIKNFEIKDWTKHGEVFGKAAKRWQNLTERSEKTGDCILHFLMKDDDANRTENKEIGKAIKNITKYHPNLMTERNNEKMTPLYLALSLLDPPRASRIKTGLFPSKMSDKRKVELAKAIEYKCGTRDENCLHLALKNCLHLVMKNKLRDTSLLETIINHASQDAINARDIGNWTPLHHAVNYQHSGESTLRIIKSLIGRGEPCPEPGGELNPPHHEYAFDAYVTWDREELSVYGYHMKTRDRTTSRVPATKANRTIDGKDTPKTEQRDLASAERQTQNPKKPVGKAQRMNQGEKANISVTRRAAETTEEAGEDDFPKPGLGRTNTFQVRTGGKAKRASSTDSTKQSQKGEDEQEGERLEYWSEQIRNELKLHCLRTRTSAQAERFLYGSNKDDIQLYFNYNGLPAENADPITFYDNFKQTRFDEVLQYVEFPALRLRKTDIPRGETFQRHRELFQSSSGGRKDLLFFFSWLKDKKVKHIISLVVRETVDPHGDDVIEACLSGFRIDILDWSKPDLDPEMLCSACPDVKELHLGWGGNNAILRAWGEPEGLRTLGKLELIYVYYDQTSDRARNKIESFKARFERPVLASGPAKTDDGREDNESIVASITSRARLEDDQPGHESERRIKVVIEQSQAREALHGPDAAILEAVIEEQSTVTVHKWLESIDAFGDQLKTLMANIRTNSHKGDEIRVALIDDGVDFCEKEFREKIMQGKSFAYYQHGNRREKQWYVSELGHGTVMAHMILRVCPMAKIYPIKLDTIRDPKKKHWDIQPDSAVKAIEAAVEKDVHIISMSWTIEKPRGDDKTAFDRALQKAEDKRILMFCSSPDDGVFSSDHYPTAWGPSKFFRIGASQADGNPYGRVSPSQVDYLFPGVDVVRANKRDIALRGFEDHNNTFTGSSVSTALAAGLAALVLWFVVIGAKYSRDENQTDGLDNNDVRKLQDVKAMRQAFQYLGAGRDSNDKFVEIWSVLEKAAQTLKEHRGHAAEDIKESRRTIFNLARDMVRKS
ncbi:hypothetical protein BDV12DRAFT_205945 [Aspergillus spectabilis]